MSWEKIVRLINENNSFLIGAHKNPEGDSLGSQLALFILLKDLGKKVAIYNADKVPSNYRFLPFSCWIKTTSPRGNFDVGFVLDCSGSFRLGKIREQFMKKSSLIVNIDHHISNDYFGDVNLVEPTASSACELIFMLYKKMKKDITPEAALCLYSGIFTDTGSFSYNSTSSRVHRIISQLIQKGIKPASVYENIYSSLSSQEMLYVSKIISSLKLSRRGKLCWVKTNLWRQFNSDITEVVFYIMRFMRKVEVIIFFKRLAKQVVRVNFRSRGRIDVNKIAGHFGGGGHKTAAGLTLRVSLDKAEEQVISYIENKFHI